MNIQSDLVNLSACESGIGPTFDGESVSGLAYAFLVAGANNLSLSLWNISDQSTADFMGQFNTNLSQGDSYQTAMSDTKRQFIKGDFGEVYKPQTTVLLGSLNMYGQ